MLDLTWDYPTTGTQADPDADAVLAEINGRGPDGPLSSYTQLTDDGTTACGCWIYCGVQAGGVNQAARRKSWRQQNLVAPDWGWASQANRRVLYNRASADPQQQAVERAQGAGLVGPGTPAVGRGRRAGLHRRPFPPITGRLRARPAWTRSPALKSFIMQADGKAWLFAPAGLVDEPLPTHYEPQESPFRNLLYGQQHNPVRQIIRHRENRYQPSGDQPGSEVFPYVTTTYRLTEHHTAGGMSRFLPYLSELQPAFFCEVSPRLAAERALEHLGWATIITARNAIEARVLVTERIRPLSVQGRTLHQVGLPWHWEPNGYTTGDAANELAHLALEWNAHTEDGLLLTGMSYDNTEGLSASTWRHVAFIEKPPADGRPRRPLADVQRRVQALHRGGLPGRLPDRRTDAHRVRHGGGPGRRLQRMRLLRVGVPVRRDRTARVRRGRAQVHALLRPAR